MTKNFRVVSNYDPRETGRSRVAPARSARCFLPTRRSDPCFRPADATLQKLPAFCSKATLVPTLNRTPLISCSNFKTPPNLYTYVRIHPYQLHQAHTCHYGIKKNDNILFLTYRQPTGQVRGLNPRVQIDGLAGRDDPTRDMNRISRVNRNLAGRVGSRRVRRCSKSHGSWRVVSGGFQISRVESSRVRSSSNLAGRVRSGQDVFTKSRGSVPVR